MLDIFHMLYYLVMEIMNYFAKFYRFRMYRESNLACCMDLLTSINLLFYYWSIIGSKTWILSFFLSDTYTRPSESIARCSGSTNSPSPSP